MMLEESVLLLCLVTENMCWNEGDLSMIFEEASTLQDFQHEPLLDPIWIAHMTAEAL